MKKGIEYNILLIGGLVLIGYWIYTRRKGGQSTVKAEPTPEKAEPKTIVLNLAQPVKSREQTRYDFTEPFAKDFNASKFATVAPPKVKIVTS